MSELKPCPFCGTIPLISTDDRKIVQNSYAPGVIVLQRILIECPKCFCKMDILLRRAADDYMPEKIYRKIQKEMVRQAIKNFWNRRAGHT